MLAFIQWKGINRKQSTRWQHLSRLKASAFFSLQKKFVVMKHSNLYLGLVLPSGGWASLAQNKPECLLLTIFFGLVNFLRGAKPSPTPKHYIRLKKVAAKNSSLFCETAGEEKNVSTPRVDFELDRCRKRFVAQKTGQTRERHFPGMAKPVGEKVVTWYTPNYV
jgi:hypothetical protein